ncbi:alpha-hydroxy-acid oxidizing protein [Nocardia sp. NPDC046763]|uniref:alpha-hydroxy-acid oxidizing protein n=1 Tax=Nocardia sp. NPDC046763 TaxID=3155256 RepID=UPI00340BCAB7
MANAGHGRREMPLPFIVKGVLSGSDAAHTVDCGASAAVVSNHGGRQLDGVPATLTQLPEVLDVIDARIEVAIDGGIRCGTDVFKALARGVHAVLIGRPVALGLALDGAPGVAEVLELFTAELRRTMLLAGCARTFGGNGVATYGVQRDSYAPKVEARPVGLRCGRRDHRRGWPAGRTFS